MISKLIDWAVNNRLVVILLTIALIGVGGYALQNLNVEAYPDPAPAIVEVIAQNPGASSEEIERQVTIPLEVALAGMPGLKYTRSKSVFGLSHIRNQFHYGVDFEKAKLEVLNRLNSVKLPKGVVPRLAPTSPTGEIYRYYISSPVNREGNPVYSLTDLKTLQDWKLEKEFRRIPRIADVVSFGGAEKRYEIQPDPDRLKMYGISLKQLESAINASNENAGGDYLIQGGLAEAVRGIGLLGGGRDPMLPALSLKDPVDAKSRLLKEDRKRLQEIREIVLTATNNVPVLVGDVVEGGRRDVGGTSTQQGVLIGQHTRMGKVSVNRPAFGADGQLLLNDKGERKWEEIPDTIEGIVLLRKGEQSLPALADVKKKVEELNTQPGSLLPGTQLETFYDRTKLVNVTTHTVQENVLVGISLVVIILLLFLNHFRSALIVAINIPLALLFALSILYFRGKSANLLSLGAVDFGIIADSSVIIVESIYRYVSSGASAELPLQDRIKKACSDVERSILFATIIMVCALLPLFTMQGPEGQIFGPMADTYAFALGGALLLSMTLSPVMCRLLFTKLKPSKDNFLVRTFKWFYLGQLRWALDHRKSCLALGAGMIAATFCAMPFLGSEFMPALEEGNIYIRSTFPVSVSLQEVAGKATIARRIMEKYPEVQSILSQVGRPDDGTDPTGYYNAEFLVPLIPRGDWPQSVAVSGWRGMLGWKARARTKDELIDAMSRELETNIPGVDWNFSQSIRDNVMETLSGVKGENSVKIIGPDLDELERLAGHVRDKLNGVRGIENVGIFSIKGQTNLEFPIDREKCARWNVSVADVQDVLETAVGGKSFSDMVEGEKSYDITLRWPARLRSSVDDILNIPVDVSNNKISDDETPGSQQLTRRDTGTGLKSFSGGVGVLDTQDDVPRRRLRDLVTPVDEDGDKDPNGSFIRSGASTISREQGKRLIAVKFSVRGRDLASAVKEAQQATAPLFDGLYRSEWSGEFQQMQEAISRLIVVVALALVLILILLYLALRSLLDACVVLSNVVGMSIGGIWALLITGTYFNISAGVGFISVLGVGIMHGLLLISGMNGARSHGVPLRQAIEQTVERRIRPLSMTALTAILGLLPAALATGIGSETQRPLAIVVVGGMVMDMALRNAVPFLYSFYGDREPPKVAGLDH